MTEKIIELKEEIDELKLQRTILVMVCVGCFTIGAFMFGVGIGNGCLLSG